MALIIASNNASCDEVRDLRDWLVSDEVGGSNYALGLQPLVMVVVV